MNKLMYIVLMTGVVGYANESKLCIKQYALNEGINYKIEISNEEPTTITFPSGLRSISGVNVTMGEMSPKMKESMVAELSYKEGDNFLIIRGLKAGGKAGLNIGYKGKTYVISLEVSKNAVRSVKFYEAGSKASNRWSKRTEVRPDRLLMLMERAKHYGLKTRNGEEDEEIEVVYPKKKTEVEGIEVNLERVLRFEEEDALVFLFWIKNKTLKEFKYLPQDLRVRIGENVHYAVTSDANPIVAPLSEIHGYCVIAGRPDGGRANLSINNDFNLIVTKVPEASLIVPVGGKK